VKLFNSVMSVRLRKMVGEVFGNIF